MKNLKFHLFIVACIVMTLAPHAWAQTVPLTFGQAQTGSVSGESQVNFYTFSANTNDVVDVTMVTTSGSLAPKLQLYESNGTLIAQNYSNNGTGGCGGPTNLEMNTVTLPASGTYTLDVSDCTGTQTGAYSLYAQRTNNPSGAASLPFDQTQDGSITAVAQESAYKFSANLNDLVDLTLVTTSGSLAPKIRLYQPNGALVAQTYSNNGTGGCGGPTNIELDTIQLPAAGTYTVLVADCTDTDTGNYAIYAQRTNNPSGAANLPFDQTQTGSITAVAQDNTYTFSANANDVTDFTLLTTSGSLAPKIRLYQPDGALVAQTYSNNGTGGCGGPTNIELNTITLPAAGTYTVLVGDCLDTNTGNYAIYAQRTNNPSGAANLPFDQTQTGSITSVVQSSTYTFSANANDVADFTLVTTSGSLAPKIRLYQPNGAFVAQNYSNNGTGGCGGPTNIELDTVTLPATGTYTVLVGDCLDANTGNFAIYSQRTNNPSGGYPVLWGQVQAGIVMSTAQSSTYTISGSVNDVVDLTVATTSGSLAPKMRLYNPNGTLLAQTYSNNGTGGCGGPATIELSSITLTQNGTYTLLVGDCLDTNSGDFNLSSQCFGTCNLVPTVTSLSPASAMTGAAAETLTINGTNFLPSSTVTYGGVAHTPAYVSSIELQIALSTGDLATPGTYAVVVTSPGPGGGPSNSVNFTVTSAGGISFSTTSLTFHNQVINTTSTASKVTLTSTGAGSLTISNISITGTDPGNFVETNNCPPSLAPNAKCTINLTFTPSATGSFSASLSVADNAPGSPQSVALSGTGVEPVVAAPASLTFSNQAEDSTSAAKSVTLTNNLSSALTVTSVSASGDFAETNTCVPSVPAKGKCTIDVTFTPTLAGTRTGTLTVIDSALNSPQTVSLTGTGVAPVSLTPASLRFATQSAGTTSTAKKITLTNNLPTALTIGTISFQGADPGDFASPTNTCGASVPSKGKCTISVTFTPGATGARSATMYVNDSASTSPQTVPLTGTGK